MNMISNVMRILIVRNTLMFNLFLPSHFEGIKGNLNALVIIMMNLWFWYVQKSSLAVEVNCAWSTMNAYGTFSIDFDTNCCVNIIKPWFSRIALFNQRLPVWVSPVLHAGVEVREQALKGWRHWAVSWRHRSRWAGKLEVHVRGMGLWCLGSRLGRWGWERELLLLLQPWPWGYLLMALLETVVRALCCVIRDFYCQSLWYSINRCFYLLEMW